MSKTEIVKHLADAIAEKRKIRLLAIKDGVRVRPMYKCAIVDDRTKDIFTGAELLFDSKFDSHPVSKRRDAIKSVSEKMFILSEEQAAKNGNDGDRTPPIAIEHNMILDLSSDADAAIFLLSFKDGGIALSKTMINTNQHYFYIDDKKAAAEQKQSLLEDKANALDIVRKIKSTQKDAWVALLGIYAKPTDHDDYTKNLALYEMADTEPNKILALYNDKKIEWKLMLQHFINNGIVRLDGARKRYTVNGQLIGMSFDEALKFITDDKNQAVINEWIKATKGDFNKEDSKKPIKED